jgi:hypothetical protein
MPHLLTSAITGHLSTHDLSLRHLRRKVYNQVWERIEDFTDWHLLDAACVPLLRKVLLEATVVLNIKPDAFSLLMPSVRNSNQIFLVHKAKDFKSIALT